MDANVRRERGYCKWCKTPVDRITAETGEEWWTRPDGPSEQDKGFYKCQGSACMGLMFTDFTLGTKRGAACVSY